MQAEKHHFTYSTVMGLLRCRLSFAMLRSPITCLRSARSPVRCPGRIDLGVANHAMSEGQMEYDLLTLHLIDCYIDYLIIVIVIIMYISSVYLCSAYTTILLLLLLYYCNFILYIIYKMKV